MQRDRGYPVLGSGSCSCCRKCGTTRPCEASVQTEGEVCEGFCFCGVPDLEIDLEAALEAARARIDELEAELARASSQPAFVAAPLETKGIEWLHHDLGHVAFVCADEEKARKVEVILSALAFVPKRVHRSTDWAELAAATTPEQLADTLQCAFMSGVQQGRVLERRKHQQQGEPEWLAQALNSGDGVYRP